MIFQGSSLAGTVEGAARDAVAPDLLRRFREFVAEQLGLQFPDARLGDLERGLRAAVLEFGFDDEASCLLWLLSSPLTQQQVEVLAGNLTVGETYFFRERKIFDSLADRILPEIMDARRGGERNLRLWSAACCTGEEAYSLAITALTAVPDWENWNVTILATDINPRFLRHARAGIYGEWSFRLVEPWVKNRFFVQEGADRFVLREEVRRLVRFGHLNLARDAYPALLSDTNAMDVVLCRNVLMYFTPEVARGVLDKLGRCIVPGGWLALGAGETAQTVPPELAAERLAGMHLFRKTPMPEGSAQTPPTPQSPPPAPLLPPGDELCRSYADGDYAGIAARLEAADAAGAKLAPPLMALLARCHANTGRLAEAALWCARATEADRTSASLQYLKGAILHEQGHLDEAAHAHHCAVRLDYDFALAHFALGNLARARQRRREAARHFENALGALAKTPRDTVLAEADGLTAGRLAEIIRATVAEEASA